MSGAIEFLLGRYFFTKDQTIEYALKKTLVAMASGGFYDQLGGGFHRYSTDEAWTVPHFEKMTEDNAWLLRNYADASFFSMMIILKRLPKTLSSLSVQSCPVLMAAFMPVWMPM